MVAILIIICDERQTHICLCSARPRSTTAIESTAHGPDSFITFYARLCSCCVYIVRIELVLTSNTEKRPHSMPQKTVINMNISNVPYNYFPIWTLRSSSSFSSSSSSAFSSSRCQCACVCHRRRPHRGPPSRTVL